MEKPKNHRILSYLVVALIVIIAVSFLAVILSQPKYLYPAEIRNYEGQNLSSVADVQANAIRGIQLINQSTYRLNVTGLVDRNLQLSYDEIINNHQKYRKIVTIYCVEGWDAKIIWEGILIKDLLAEAGIKPNATVVIFYASDGYSTSLPLDYITSKNILLAYKMNNITMPQERGFPFELVAESQYGYKWIKWVTQIVASDNESYRGYWESRGYPDNATLRP